MRVPRRGTGADQPVRAKKSRNGDGAKGLNRSALPAGQPETGGTGSSRAKPFRISKKLVWEAYKRVKANKGAAGVDEESITDFERDLKNNLYKIWNRMSSGSYFPPAVRTVAIPKSGGGQRLLGIPTVSDRIAQMVVKLEFEPELEPIFHEDSYGYRRGKSAVDAVRMARERCWRLDWVIDLDIQGFFDNLDHELLLRAVRKHTDCKWIVLYIERWLKAPVQMEDGALVEREKGVPQGGVVSPLLSNLFLHYAFDEWMRRNHPRIPFERYSDDIVVHCISKYQATEMTKRIGQRLVACRLALHPEKTRIVYCKDGRRKGNHSNVKFDFLGFSFQPRMVRRRGGGLFLGYTPAVSMKAAKRMRDVIRSWQLHNRSDKSLEDLARKLNPVVRGWVNYYGNFTRSALRSVFNPLHFILAKWAMRKYRRLRGRPNRARRWLKRIRNSNPELFAHWQLSLKPVAGR